MAVTTKNQIHHGGTETRREAFGIKRKSNTNPQDGKSRMSTAKKLRKFARKKKN
jgi:hypothetical protein